MSKVIMGIQLQQRNSDAAKLQEILTEHGCSILTRVGMHMATKDECSPKGLILLEFMEDADDVAEFEGKLNALGNVVVKKMEF